MRLPTSVLARSVLATAVTLGLVAGGLTGLNAHAVAQHQPQPQPQPQHSGTPQPTHPGGPQRFLAVTGGNLRTSFSKVEEVGEQAADARDVACTARNGKVAALPNGWCLSPAGRQIDVLRFPLGVTPTSNGKVVVSSDSGGVQGLTVIDQQSLDTTQTTAGNLFVGVAETKDHRVYAAGGNADRVFRYRFAGDRLASQDVTQTATAPVGNALNGVTGRLPLGGQSVPAVDGIAVSSYPGALLSWGDYVLAAGTLSEASNGACPDRQPACGRVSVLDSRTDAVVGRVALGLDPYAMAVDPVRKLLYVTNWADEAGRGAGQGTVSTVDLSNPLRPRELSVTPVGHHPAAVVLSADRSHLFVANTNDDSLSVLDVTGTPRVLATESLRPVQGAPVGAHPDALVLSPDGATLFVALAGLNAVEVRDGRTGARVAGRPVYLPTGWYPSALAVTGTAVHYKLWVTNAKGIGPGPGYNASIFANGTNTTGSTNGTVSAIDLPASADATNRWTAAVMANDRFDTADVSPCASGRGVVISQVLCPPAGRQSPLRHIVYVVTENKTYDQYFGDLPQGPNGYRADPT